MTRMSMLRVALGFVGSLLLVSCELVAGIPERTQVAAGGCESFCELAGRLCTDKFAVYHGNQDCPTACALYSTEDRKCREDALKSLQNSSSNEAYLYCARASLGGGGVCGGTPCRNYCDTMAKVCSEYPEDSVNYPEADGTHSEACEKQCSVIPDKEKQQNRGPGESTFDVIADHEGDTVQCRLVHLTLATQDDSFARDHCAHAHISPKPMNGGKSPWCGGPIAVAPAPTCEDYCAVVMEACIDNGGDDNHKVYDDGAQCRAACGAMVKGDLSVYASTNDVACRKYHSYNAAVFAKPEVHCPHAGPGGAEVCGDDCESLCRLVEKGCPDEYKAEYDGSANSCAMACDTARKADPAYKGDGMSYSVANAKRGDAFSCRLYSAAQSVSLRNDASDVCAVAVGKAPCPFPED